MAEDVAGLRLTVVELGTRVAADLWAEGTPWALLFIRARGEDAHKRFDRTLAQRPVLAGIPGFGDPELTEAVHVALWRVLSFPAPRRRRRVARRGRPPDLCRT